MANFKNLILTLLTVMMGVIAAQASAPRWVRKGTDALNKQRYNDSYTLVRFNTHDLDQRYLVETGKDVLATYSEENYGARFGTVEVMQTTPGPNPQYLITYQDFNGKDNMIEAMLVDTYLEFDDFDLNAYEWEYYQLYAISKPNMTPVYDRFELTKNYNGQAFVKSLIPGLGQLDKGQTTKGYVIMGGEIFFAGAALVFDWKRRDADKEMHQSDYVDNWRSKRQSWQNFEIGAAGCFVALYIYNLIDAATSKGASQVQIKKASPTNYTLLPYAAPQGMGMSLTVTF